MNIIDNRRREPLSHDNRDRDGGHVISLDAVRLARSGGSTGSTGSTGSAAAGPVDSSLPLEQERATGCSSARGADVMSLPDADVVHLAAGSACRAAMDGGHRSTKPSRSSSGSPSSVTSRPGLPDLAAIAREPDHATRRAELKQAMALFSGGQEVSERLVDHQMIVTGLAAGHVSNDDGSTGEDTWPLGSGMDDPAVVVGLVLHHVRHSVGCDMPIPPTVLRQLDRHVARGSPAARLVRDWLSARLQRKDRQHPADCQHLQVCDGGTP